MQLTFCPSCGAKLEAHARFCSQCGFDITRLIAPKEYSLKAMSILVVVSILGVLIIWPLQGLLIGKAPSQQHGSQSNTGQSKESDQSFMTTELNDLKQKAEKDSSLESLRAYASALWNRSGDFQNPPQGLIFELMEIVARILKNDPKDSTALLMMANVSFNQKIFNKAAEYYKQYLDLKSDDIEARASYASSLTFLGQFENALKELDIVLKADPDFFQALAYKAITYAQMGNMKDAVELGTRALKVAPTDEARERFAKFLDSIKDSAPIATPSDPVETFIKSHAIAGSKFVKSEMDNAVLVLYFRDFPMSAMPEFAKTAFINKTKAQAEKMPNVKSLRFVDVDSKEIMNSVDVK